MIIDEPLRGCDNGFVLNSRVTSAEPLREVSKPVGLLRDTVHRWWVLAAAMVAGTLVAAAYGWLYLDFHLHGTFTSEQLAYRLQGAGAFVLALTLATYLFSRGRRGGRGLSGPLELAVVSFAILATLCQSAAQFATAADFDSSGSFHSSFAETSTQVIASVLMVLAVGVGATLCVTSGEETLGLRGLGQRILGVAACLAISAGSFAQLWAALFSQFGLTSTQLLVVGISSISAGVTVSISGLLRPTHWTRFIVGVALMVRGGGWVTVSNASSSFKLGEYATGTLMVGFGYALLVGAGGWQLTRTARRERERPPQTMTLRGEGDRAEMAT